MIDYIILACIFQLSIYYPTPHSVVMQNKWFLSDSYSVDKYCWITPKPLQVIQLYFALPWNFGNMYGISLYCKETWGGGGGGVVFCDSSTTPGYTTLLCSALDCGNEKKLYHFIIKRSSHLVTQRNYTTSSKTIHLCTSCHHRHPAQWYSCPQVLFWGVITLSLVSTLLIFWVIFRNVSALIIFWHYNTLIIFRYISILLISAARHNCSNFSARHKQDITTYKSTWSKWQSATQQKSLILAKFSSYSNWQTRVAFTKLFIKIPMSSHRSWKILSELQKWAFWWSWRLFPLPVYMFDFIPNVPPPGYTMVTAPPVWRWPGLKAQTSIITSHSALLFSTSAGMGSKRTT